MKDSVNGRNNKHEGFITLGKNYSFEVHIIYIYIKVNLYFTLHIRLGLKRFSK